METLVFFAAIAAIQIFASYMKQKKEREEAAKKVQQRGAQPQQRASQERTETPTRPAVPPQAAPMPDPLKDLMRQLGMPEPSKAPPPPPPTQERTRDEKRPLEKSASDTVEERAARPFVENKPARTTPRAEKHKAKAVPPPVVLQATTSAPLGDLGISIEDAAKEANRVAMGGISEMVNTADLRKGILWATILQEPRFRRPWSPAHR